MTMSMERREFIKWGGLAAVVGALPGRGLGKESKEEERKGHSEEVVRYLERLYADGHRRYAFRKDYPGGFEQWQKDARPVLRRMIGLENIAARADGHTAEVELAEPTDQGSYTRQRGSIETEPHVRIPFWLLKPRGQGPFPLAMFPHGHDKPGQLNFFTIPISKNERLD